MNAIVFVIVAALVVVTALAAVALPRVRDAGAALLATLVLIAVLSFAGGQYLVGLAELAAAAGGAAAARSVLVLGRRGGRPQSEPRVPRLWWLGAAVAAPIGVLFAVVLGLSGSHLVSGSGGPGPVSVLGAQEPYALVIVVVLALAGAGAGLLLGRTAADEREADAHQEARRTRDHRMRARREAREAARRARREASPAGEGR